eukprot:scaffold1849_cov239-Pinguiococcus_pyrenoidosus.AAC.1
MLSTARKDASLGQLSEGGRRHRAEAPTIVRARKLTSAENAVKPKTFATTPGEPPDSANQSGGRQLALVDESAASPNQSASTPLRDS